MSLNLWVSEDNWIGVRGVNSIDEYVDTIVEKYGFFGYDLEELFNIPVNDPQLRTKIYNRVWGRFECFKISTNNIYKENWADITRISIDIKDRPGKGFIKIIGLDLV